jgi:hypothetical protein
MLVVLDGWGWREDPVDNAVRQAHTPNFDRLWRTCPHALLQASGKDVGLPPGQMENSEVGHLNIGAGRVVMQDLQRINDAMADGWLKSAPALVNLIACLRRTGGTCHLLGLASPGGVHSHKEHAAALAALLSQAGIPTVVHIFTDGRDTPPRSAKDDMKRLSASLLRWNGIARRYGTRLHRRRRRAFRIGESPAPGPGTGPRRLGRLLGHPRPERDLCLPDRSVRPGGMVDRGRPGNRPGSRQHDGLDQFGQKSLNRASGGCGRAAFKWQAAASEPRCAVAVAIALREPSAARFWGRC